MSSPFDDLEGAFNHFFSSIGKGGKDEFQALSERVLDGKYENQNPPSVGKCDDVRKLAFAFMCLAGSCGAVLRTAQPNHTLRDYLRRHP